MSNDLISRSALLKALEEKVYPEKYGEKCNTLDVINGVLQVISEQPTAHDVDKVVERLEARKEYLTNEFVLADISRQSKEKTLERINEIAGMIEIVKSGGIE